MLIYKLLSFLYSYTPDNSGAKSALNLLRADFGIDIQEIRTWGFWRRFLALICHAHLHTCQGVY